MPIKADEADAHYLALKNISENHLATDVKLQVTSDGANLIIGDKAELTKNGEAIFNPLNLHGTASEQIMQLLKATENGTIGKITGRWYNRFTIPSSISTIMDEDYISNLQKMYGNSGLLIYANSVPHITNKGFEFMNMQEREVTSVTTNYIKNSNDVNVTNGNSQNQINTHTSNIEITSNQTWQKFDEAIKDLSNRDQAIANEIKNDIQHDGSVYPKKWSKFKSFFEKNPHMTDLIGKLIVASATIGTSFIN